MKKFLILILAIVTCMSFAGCTKKYVKDVEAIAISKALQRSITTDGGYREAGESFMPLNIGAPEHCIKEFRIVVAADDVNQNEIGVFRANSTGNAKEIAKYCQKYIDNEKANYNPDYEPDEAVKVENATVHVFGIYVVYTILTPEDTDYALIVIDNLISEGA